MAPITATVETATKSDPTAMAAIVPAVAVEFRPFRQEADAGSAVAADMVSAAAVGDAADL
jgi:hypothetical protein